MDQAPGIGFDAVVCASGSALTHAGILVGLRALGEQVPVLGICVRRDAASQGARVARVASALAAMIDCPAAFDAGDVDVSDAVLAPGYGRLNEAVREAMTMAARHEGLLLGADRGGQPGAVRPHRWPAGGRRLGMSARIRRFGWGGVQGTGDAVGAGQRQKIIYRIDQEI